MNAKGYLLIEMLVASVLLSIAGSGLYTGLMQGLTVEKVIRKSNALYDPPKILWMRAGKDLRNAILLQEYKFSGKQDEIIFPVLTSRLVGDNKEVPELRRIRYFVKDGALKRSEEEISNQLVKDNPKEKIMLKEVEQVRFQYAYLDEEERLAFKPFWMEAPYFGIPKAIKIEVKLKKSKKILTKLISIPQGRWGHMNSSQQSDFSDQNNEKSKI